MSDDSFVQLSFHQCPVCGAEHQYKTEILIHKRMKSFKSRELGIAGDNPCETHAKIIEDGKTILIEVLDPPTDTARVSALECKRTGRMCYIDNEVVDSCLTAGAKITSKRIAFVQVGVFEQIEKLIQEHINKNEF